MVTRLNKGFFERAPQTVAKDLVGRVLVHRLGNGRELVGVIQETAAYAKPLGKRITQNYEGMSQEAGRIHIFGYRGNKLLNITTNPANGEPSVVHIYAVMPVKGVDVMGGRKKKPHQLANGPGKLTKSFKITKVYDGASLLRGDVWIEGRGVPYSRVSAKKGLADICLGHYKLK